MTKKILALFLFASILLCGCANKQDLETLQGKVDSIEQRLSQLETLCNELNTNISSLKTLVEAMQKQDYITATVPIKQGDEEIGYTLSFKNSPDISIYHGSKGKTPAISVKQGTDGVYYWTLDGEWILDEASQKMPVSGKDGNSPQLKIGEDGNWYISYNGGSTWELVGPASGNDGDAFFDNVSIDSEANTVQFMLSNGSSFSIALYCPIDIYFSYVYDDKTGISAGQSIVIPYTLSGSESDKAVVTASSDGKYQVSVDNEAKIITVLCPKDYSDGYINVLVFDGNGYAVVRVINFYENKLSFASGLEYSLDVTGGELSIPMTFNFDYNLTISTSDGENWISQVPQSKVESKTENLVFMVQPNSKEIVRTATISIIPRNSTQAEEQIIINQASASFSIDKTRSVFDANGGEALFNIVSSRGLKVSKAQDCNWLTENIQSSESRYTLSLTASQNYTVEPRNTKVLLYTGDGSKKLAEIEIVQAADGSENPNALIITVQPLFANNYIVYLPINQGAKVDCFVDWGDGSVNRYQLDYDNNKVFHQYDNPAIGSTFDVKITGYVPSLLSTIGDDYLRSIIAVKQWGNVGIKSMLGAFKKNKNLVSIAADTAGAFENVETFAQAFYDCDALTSIPDGLFEYASKATNFNQLFNLCDNLSTIPARLFKNCVNAKEFKQTFENCPSIVTVPEQLFYNCSSATNFNNVFAECDGITTIGDEVFLNCSSAQIFTKAFYHCSALESVPESLFKSCIAATNFTDVFSTTPLAAIPAKLFADCENASLFVGTFNNCTKLTTVPEGIFHNNPNVSEFASTFRRCSNLTSVPVTLFDNNRKVKSFNSTFDDCGKLAGESPYTIIDGVKYHVPQRKLKPDYFITPTTTEYYMYGTLFSDRNNY